MLEPGPNHGDFLAPDRQRRGADGEHKQGQPKQQTAVALHHYTKFGEVAPEMTAIANKAPMVVGAYDEGCTSIGNTGTDVAPRLHTNFVKV